MKFEPLTEQNFEQAIELVKIIFPTDIDTADSPILAYSASLWPEKYNESFIQHYHIKTLEYFLVFNEDDVTPVGVTGLYARTIDPPDLIWLGWYGVHPAYRRKGFGKAILEWTIELARSRGFKTMRLYTSRDESNAAAQPLYDLYGFSVIGEGIGVQGVGEIIFREKKL